MLCCCISAVNGAQVIAFKKIGKLCGAMISLRQFDAPTFWIYRYNKLKKKYMRG